MDMTLLVQHCPKHHYGGGGSGLFLPGQKDSRQYEPPCYIVVDLDKFATRKKAFT